MEYKFSKGKKKKIALSTVRRKFPRSVFGDWILYQHRFLHPLRRLHIVFFGKCTKRPVQAKICRYCFSRPTVEPNHHHEPKNKSRPPAAGNTIIANDEDFRCSSVRNIDEVGLVPQLARESMLCICSPRTGRLASATFKNYNGQPP